jgi:hypothetical protein
MNEKLKAILLKIATELRQFGWRPSGDYELNFRNSGHFSVRSSVKVEGTRDDETWTEGIDIELDLGLDTNDQITYYPEYELHGEIFMQGGNISDLEQVMDINVSFTENDVNNNQKIKLAAQQINTSVQGYVQEQYQEYINDN